MRTFGSVSELSSTCQVPLDAARTYTSVTSGCTNVEPKARPGLGLRWRISAIMSARSSSLTPHSRRKAARSRLAKRTRCSTRVRIAGSKRSRSLSWMASHSVRLRAHTAGRIGNRQRHLLGELSGERNFGGDESFQIVGAVLAAAGAHAGPFRIGRRRHFRLRAFLAAVVRENIFEFGAKPLFHGAAAGLHVLADPVGGGCGLFTALAALAAFGAFGRGPFRLAGTRRRFVIVIGALEQRI